MSKVILILDDMPKHCSDCLCFDSNWGDCNVTNNDVGNVRAFFGNRPEWCPLRELPEKVDPIPSTKTEIERQLYMMYNHGWNACLDKIQEDEG